MYFTERSPLLDFVARTTIECWEKTLMSVETMIANLSPQDRLSALELLWIAIDRDTNQFVPPDWHKEVLAYRLENPSPKPALPLQDAMDEIRQKVNERRTPS